jgi:hypothetical protein
MQLCKDLVRNYRQNPFEPDQQHLHHQLGVLRHYGPPIEMCWLGIYAEIYREIRGFIRDECLEAAV